jgi:hypothetical protein
MTDAVPSPKQITTCCDVAQAPFVPAVLSMFRNDRSAPCWHSAEHSSPYFPPSISELFHEPVSQYFPCTFRQGHSGGSPFPPRCTSVRDVTPNSNDTASLNT